MKPFVNFFVVFLLGPVMLLAGIAGIVLTFLYLKNLVAGVLVNFVCIWLIVYGVSGIWIVFFEKDSGGVADI